ncbi:hypothetical protein F3Y22_tig00112289pilonHSYRG00252 [Hibiscus syriacus]|uniref:Uncharacterized protein n=1 Tax=Hibiscus syriacus TaxID=106335 RepID=A0A6A2Y9X3_HIBSY|nr:hypothetical protein F3Y22_tig00112289pilonHSYRG00252 [Hibiscus syriacus]
MELREISSSAEKGTVKRRKTMEKKEEAKTTSKVKLLIEETGGKQYADVMEIAELDYSPARNKLRYTTKGREK